MEAILPFLAQPHKSWTITVTPFCVVVVTKAHPVAKAGGGEIESSFWWSSNKLLEQVGPDILP